MSAFLGIAVVVIAIIILVALLKVACSLIVVVIGLAFGVAAFLLAERVIGKGR